MASSVSEMEMVHLSVFELVGKAGRMGRFFVSCYASPAVLHLIGCECVQLKFRFLKTTIIFKTVHSLTC